MTNGECPKCGSHEVYAINGFGHQANLWIGFWHVAYLTYLVCTKCGYVESYIFEKSDLKKIAQKGQRVIPK